MPALRLAGISLASLAIVACGQENAEIQTDGMIAELNGQVVRITADQEAEICESNFCEPNFIYHASFGRSRPSPPPAPAPPPVQPPPPPPAPTPPPGGGGSPIQETLDYSRFIMNVDDAWRISRGSREIVVAVVDTGVDVNHRDLQGNIWVNEIERLGRSGVDDDGNGYVDDVYGYDFANNRPNAIDDQRHGTHCAGIIGAVENGIGIVGVAPQVKIMPIKFLDSNGSGSTDAAIRAIDYAVANGADIISNSWGGGGRSDLLDQAIQRAHNAGILVVAAAGNESSNNDSRPTYPANYRNVLAVASTDENDNISSFSNTGRSTVEIAAPGSRILSTVLNGDWARLSGTSMATPQVAGALALAKSVRGNLSVNDYKSALCDSAQAIHLGQVACGRMDVFRFLEAVRRF